MSSYYHVAVVGAGLIGASAAFHVARHFKTVLIEQEPQPGYHSSGRSAAVLLPPYGGPLARALTKASIPFLLNPPVGFSDCPLTAPRGALFLAGEGQRPLLDRWQQDRSEPTSAARMLSAAEATQYVPILLAEQISAALLLSDVLDIDAAALLQGFLKAFRSQDGTLLLNSKVGGICLTDGMWVLETLSGTVRAKVLMNAAGAWADELAELAGVAPKSLMPTRRTMVLVDGPPGVDVRQWPLVADAAESFYFKPESGRLVVSPADHSPVGARDIQPEEWDVAVAIDRLERATSLRVKRIAQQWAGLRTLSPDEEPIIGFDLDAPNFLWAAGFGGFGVQSAVAAGRCCDALICRQQLSAELPRIGIALDQLSPARLIRANTRPDQ